MGLVVKLELSVKLMGMVESDSVQLRLMRQSSLDVCEAVLKKANVMQGRCGVSTFHKDAGCKAEKVAMATLFEMHTLPLVKSKLCSLNGTLRFQVDRSIR